MSLSFLSSSGRYTVVAIGLIGLLTSMHLACSFDDDPPAKTNPVTDSGPTADAKENDDPNRTADASNGGYYGSSGYGYGYDPEGCYGYGYGYQPTYGGYNSDCQ